ncbi:MAG: CBS domain-containing protein [Candidatus Omnitrophica bacterium]|nr:CBS domain-containing protein [Candidatus Omnitrophota bacterium]
MRVRELMTGKPAACVPSDSCAVVGEIMGQWKCGFVPIVENYDTKRVIGVVTDRDLLLQLVGTDRAPSQLPVGQCMTRAVKSVSPDTELEEAAKMMEEAAVHRLPVVEEGRLVGVLSIKDIALAARKQWAHAGPHVAERQLTEILEAIAAAR